MFIDKQCSRERKKLKKKSPLSASWGPDIINHDMVRGWGLKLRRRLRRVVVKRKVLESVKDTKPFESDDIFCR